MHKLIIDPNQLAQIVSKEGLILDCTVGSGTMSKIFLSRGQKVYGCDCFEDSKIQDKNYSHYKGYFQSFIKTQEFKKLDFISALIDLGISDMQAQGDFSYYSDKLRFHLTEPKIKYNNLVNTITLKHLTKMCKSRTEAINIINNRPIKSNSHLSSLIHRKSCRNSLFYNLFDVSNEYMEKCCEGICNLLINKPNIIIYVFAFCNYEIQYIRGMKFIYNVLIEEIKIIPIKTHFYLYKIRAHKKN